MASSCLLITVNYVMSYGGCERDRSVVLEEKGSYIQQLYSFKQHYTVCVSGFTFTQNSPVQGMTSELRHLLPS